MQKGVRLRWAEGAAKISYALQQSLDAASTIKAKLNSEGQAGFAYVYNYQPGVQISVSSMAEVKNIFSGGHKIGLGVKFDG